MHVAIEPVGAIFRRQNNIAVAFLTQHNFTYCPNESHTSIVLIIENED